MSIKTGIYIQKCKPKKAFTYTKENAYPSLFHSCKTYIRVLVVVCSQLEQNVSGLTQS